METPQLPEPQRKSCLERAFILLIRLTFALLMGVAIGVGIYYGATLLYGQYLSLTQDYDARITALEAAQSENEELISDRLSGFQTRLETLEIQGDSQKESLADLESRLETYDEYISYQATVVAGQQLTQQSLEGSITDLQTQVNTLQSDLETIQDGLDGIAENFAAMETTNEELVETIAENRATIDALNELVQTKEERLMVLQHQIVFLQAMELLTRTRMNLIQGNITLAQSDIEAARQLLIDLKPELDVDQASYVEEIIAILDEISVLLPNDLLGAADKLERAWQMMAIGLSGEYGATDNITSVVTPTPEPTQEEATTPTPTSAPELTPTPTP